MLGHHVISRPRALTPSACLLPASGSTSRRSTRASVRCVGPGTILSQQTIQHLHQRGRSLTLSLALLFSFSQLRRQPVMGHPCRGREFWVLGGIRVVQRVEECNAAYNQRCDRPGSAICVCWSRGPESETSQHLRQHPRFFHHALIGFTYARSLSDSHLKGLQSTPMICRMQIIVVVYVPSHFSSALDLT